jgi:hypothetical protein
VELKLDLITGARRCYPRPSTSLDPLLACSSLYLELISFEGRIRIWLKIYFCEGKLDCISGDMHNICGAAPLSGRMRLEVSRKSSPTRPFFRSAFNTILYFTF